jgi:tetratricopeptide (TPR) repeat protein
MSYSKKISKLVSELSADSFSPEKNFELGLEYEELGQAASAVSFFLRAAEYGYKSDPIIVYSSLLKISICIEGQSDRKHTVSNSILQAIAYSPERPEAYFLLSKFYEKEGNWQECYTFATIGLKCLKNSFIKLPISIGDYHGDFALEFQIAVSAWWIGRKEESIEILKKLNKRNDLSVMYKEAVASNLINLGIVY